MSVPHFPGEYFPITNNQNNVTVVDKDYMDERDKEIRQIELALGQDLVPSTNEPLAKYLKVAPPNLLLVPSGGNVGIRTTEPTATLEVAGYSGSSNNRNFKVTFPAGGDLANTEFSALTHLGLEGLERRWRSEQ
jgi:hypothetical protein